MSKNRAVQIEMGLSNELLRTWRMMKNLDLNYSLTRHLPAPDLPVPRTVFSMCFGPDCAHGTKDAALEAGPASFRRAESPAELHDGRRETAFG